MNAKHEWTPFVILAIIFSITSCSLPPTDQVIAPVSTNHKINVYLRDKYCPDRSPEEQE
jgi:hypothetical protein